MTTLEPLQARAKALHLHGLLAHWPEAVAAGWVASLLNWLRRSHISLDLGSCSAHAARWGWGESVDDGM